MPTFDERWAPLSDMLPDVGEPLIPSGPQLSEGYDPFTPVAKGLARDIPRAAKWLYQHAPRSPGEAWDDAKAIAKAIGQSVAHDVAVPGALAKPNPHPPGSELWYKYEDLRSQAAIEWAPMMALNTLGAGLPFAKKGAAGMFGGDLAQTADQIAFAEARRMQAAGASREEIRAATGLDLFPDKKLRFEIDDSAAKLTPRGEAAVASEWGGVGTMADYFEHPELYRAYPQFRDVPVSIEPPTQRGVQGSFWHGGQPPGDISAADIMISTKAKDPRSVFLHEGSHLIQHLQDFAPGSTTSMASLRPGTASWDLYQQIRANLTRPTPIEQMPPGVLSDTYTYADYVREYKAAMASPEKRAQLDRMAQEAAVREAYRRSAGENEANIAVTRRDYTPEQRRVIPPEASSAVPFDRQIVDTRRMLNPQQSELRQMADDANVILGANRTDKPTAAAALAARTAAERNNPRAAIGGNNPPPDIAGSLNPLRNEDVYFRGKQPHEFTPEDMQAFGEYYGTDKPLGPLSELKTLKDAQGREFTVPGGTEGEWTYADVLHMKANPINPSQMDRGLHTEMQQKLGRTMTPKELTDADVWNGLIFGMTSPNNPLFPNQIAASRLRLRTPEMLDDLASMIPWKHGEKVTKQQRKVVNDAIAERYGLNKAAAGGLGTRGTADYSRIGELAQMFKKDPSFFRKKGNETWGEAVERISSQIEGLSMKTGSFGTVWQDPAEAAISAIDRHMARELNKTGGLFKDDAARAAWEDRSLSLWNRREEARVAKQTKENAKKAAEGKRTKDVAPADLADSFEDMVSKRGSDGFIGEMLLSHVGDAKTPKLKNKKGEINPNIPGHLKLVDWVEEPTKVYKMGQAYKRALDVNQKAADAHGLNLFMSQWMEWDRIRRRFEPHENMFPGLSKLPAPSVEQLRRVDAAHKQTGHKTYGKTDEGTLKPTRPLKGNAAQMGYYGLAGAAALPPLAQRYYSDTAD